jgi:hypothetical protein
VTAETPIGTVDEEGLAEIWTAIVAMVPVGITFWFRPVRIQFNVPAVAPATQVSCFSAVVAAAEAVNEMVDTSWTGYEITHWLAAGCAPPEVERARLRRVVPPGSPLLELTAKLATPAAFSGVANNARAQTTAAK